MKISKEYCWYLRKTS